jgi:hypothetical protein
VRGHVVMDAAGGSVAASSNCQSRTNSGGSTCATVMTKAPNQRAMDCLGRSAACAYETPIYCNLVLAEIEHRSGFVAAGLLLLSLVADSIGDTSVLQADAA